MNHTEDLEVVRTFGVFFLPVNMEPVLHPLGKIIKTHGYNGTTLLVSNRTLDDDVECIKEIFVLIDGLPVPFPVESFDLITDTSAHLKLEFIENQNEAQKLAGCEVFSEVAFRKHEQEASLETWMGFTIYDAQHGKIGVIEKIEDYRGNVVMQVMNGNRETLISLYPEMITRIEHRAKKIWITAPDGYF